MVMTFPAMLVILVYCAQTCGSGPESSTKPGVALVVDGRCVLVLIDADIVSGGQTDHAGKSEAG